MAARLDGGAVMDPAATRTFRDWWGERSALPHWHYPVNIGDAPCTSPACIARGLSPQGQGALGRIARAVEIEQLHAFAWPQPKTPCLCEDCCLARAVISIITSREVSPE